MAFTKPRTKTLAPKAKLIFNPNAGKGTKIIGNRNSVSLEDIKYFLEKYQIPVDLAPTKAPGHATILAQKAIKEGYKTVLAAGGDGTVSEAAAGLVGSEICLGIIPLGTFMNTAKMLAIPTNNLELAIAILKIGRTRKIDVGQISPLVGGGLIAASETKESVQPVYTFLENAGVGLEAQLQSDVLEWERGNKRALIKILGTLSDYYGNRITVVLDNKHKLVVCSPLVEISNGPYTGAELSFAPIAKLNDHRLTVSIFHMTKWEIINYFLHRSRMYVKTDSPKIERHQAKEIKIYTRVPRLVHADARVFGSTPVQLKIIPNALNVIAGFPKLGESALIKRTFLDP